MTGLAAGLALIGAQLSPPRNAFADVPVAYVSAAVLLALGVAGQLRLAWLLNRSRADRIDLAPGQSVYKDGWALWQQGVLDPQNYTPGTGRVWIRRIVTAFAINFLCVLAGMSIAFLWIL